ncbi:Bifunctional thiamine biosynthesis protein ThiDN [uncultured archaeon]|nr:Bifunctional thiamine biosynthesis protein ThiDN [uncultured archaeon]
MGLQRTKNKLVALTVGGSDAGGGAGIQADIKTFSVFGVHGTSAITAITAQNTLGVQHVFCLEPEVVTAQLRSITNDFHVAYAKTGMLYSEEIVSAVAKHIVETGIPLVVDPVIEAEAGGRLLRPDAVAALMKSLLPIASVVTPNIFEARAIAGVVVKDVDSAEIAARRIADLGPRAVIVKGGHLDCTDLVLEDDKVHLLKGERVTGGNHGVGCTYSASLTALLAKGLPLIEAATKAKQFAAQAISWSMDVGHGVGPVDQAGNLREEANKFEALLNEKGRRDPCD